MESQCAKCAFYQKEDGTRVYCEGLFGEESTIILTFPDRTVCWSHRHRYCNSIKNYTKCPIARILSEKYKCV